MFDENLYQETISALHASEDTLSEVMNMTHKTKRRGRLRTTAVLAAVIAILCCMAAAAAALGLDQRLAEYFGATAEQEELLSTAAVPMNIVKRDSGAVMLIEQVITEPLLCGGPHRLYRAGGDSSGSGLLRIRSERVRNVQGRSGNGYLRHWLGGIAKQHGG